MKQTFFKLSTIVVINGSPIICNDFCLDEVDSLYLANKMVEKAKKTFPSIQVPKDKLRCDGVYALLELTCEVSETIWEVELEEGESLLPSEMAKKPSCELKGVSTYWRDSYEWMIESKKHPNIVTFCTQEHYEFIKRLVDLGDTYEVEKDEFKFTKIR